MGWNGNGTYSRTNGTNTGATLWNADAAAGTKITTARHDTHDEDIATAITACLTKNMETKPTADFVPNTTTTYDLGTTSLKWEDLHLNGDALIGGTLGVTGNATFSGTITVDSIVQPKIKIVDIGDWDMNATVSVTVAHGLTLANIRSLQVLIRNDTDGTYYELAQIHTGSGAISGYFNVGATNVSLQRETSGFFDSTAFDSTTYNRGWVTITYV